MAIASIAHAHDPVRIIVGVDTHKDSHVGHAKDGLGRDLGHLEVPTTARGYASLLAWSRGFGDVAAFGVEGTSSYGIGLARYLQSEGQLVLEVIRPGRQDRRFRGQVRPHRCGGGGRCGSVREGSQPGSRLGGKGRDDSGFSYCKDLCDQG